MMPIAAFQFLLLGVFLLSNSKIQFHARLWFGLFLLGKGTIISLNILLADSNSFDYDTLIFFQSIYQPIIHFYPPALYLYVRSQVVKDYKMDKTELFHFAPSAIFAFTNILLLLSLSGIGNILLKYGNWLYYAQALTYSILSLRLLYLFDVLKGDSQQQHNNVMIKEWLTKLMGMFLLIMLVFLSSYIFSYFQLISSEITATITATGLTLLFFFATGSVLQILYKPEIFEKIVLIIEAQKAVSLPKVVNDITEQRLKKLMVEQKPFLELEFNAQLLAKLLGIHPRSLSLLIKHRLKTNFNDLTNKFRVLEAQRLISVVNQDMNLAQIQYQSGFNSKSVFNDVFKKFVKMTPSQFKILQQEQQVEAKTLAV